MEINYMLKLEEKLRISEFMELICPLNSGVGIKMKISSYS